MNRMYIFTVTICGLLLLSGCNKDDQYEKAYQSAWEDEGEPDWWASEEAKAGYNQGLDDSWMYYEGYSDALDHKKPEYVENKFYMEGYQDGKKFRWQ